MQFKALNKLLRIIRSIDSYGHPISLTYKNESTFKSLLGGVFTILTRLCVFAFLLSEILDVINKKSTVKIADQIINYSLD